MRDRPADTAKMGAMAVALLLAIVILNWANHALGETRGIIDHGVWYEVQGDSHAYYEKGVDPDNQFLSFDSAYSLTSRRPDFRGLVTDKYGAAIERRGLIGPFTGYWPWKLFDTEEAAEVYLIEAGVPPQNIYRRHR